MSGGGMGGEGKGGGEWEMGFCVKLCVCFARIFLLFCGRVVYFSDFFPHSPEMMLWVF